METSSWASSKDYSLPADLVAELREAVKSGDSTQVILDSYLPPIAAAQATSDPHITPSESAFMTALLNEPDTMTANMAPAYLDSLRSIILFSL